MNMIYKSKTAKWFVCFCIGMTIAFIGSIYLCYTSTLALLVDIIFMGSGLMLMYDMLLHTDYTIRGEKLHIRCGILFRMTVSVTKISEITHKSTPISSPALSAKRIGLKYGKTNWVYVSPKDQEDFIATLKSLNPTIKIS